LTHFNWNQIMNNRLISNASKNSPFGKELALERICRLSDGSHSQKRMGFLV
jgi:hypothetical protein